LSLGWFRPLAIHPQIKDSHHVTFSPVLNDPVIDQVMAQYPIPYPQYERFTEMWGDHWRAKITSGDGRTFLLKERPRHIRVDDWQFHHYVQPTQAPSPIIPALHQTRDGATFVRHQDRYFEIMDWLPGQARGLVTDQDLLDAAHTLADLHNWMHIQPVPSVAPKHTATTNDLDTWSDKFLNDKLAGPEVPAFVDRTYELISQLPDFDRIAVHGDFHPYNLLWQDGRISGICDWEDAHLNSPYFDLAYFLTHATLIDWPERKPVEPEASVRHPVDRRLHKRVISAYRQRLRRPLPADSVGLKHALITCWLITVRLTVFRYVVDTNEMAPARAVLEWLADDENLHPWTQILSG